MAINFTRDVITSGYNLSKINSNFEKIQTALQDAVSRNGAVPNQISTTIDMNGNDIINIKNFSAQNLLVGGNNLTNLKDEIKVLRDETEQFSNSAAGYSSASANSAAVANNLVTQATAGFLGFVDGLGYDFGSVSTSTTYFNQDWGSIA